MERNEFLKKAIIEALYCYEMIDLEPTSQTSVSVIINKNKVLLSSLSTGKLVEVTPEDLINNYCGRLLVNNISCNGYNEGNWLTARTYEIETILKENKKIEDFEDINTITIMKFVQLLKALLSDANKNDRAYFVNMLYAEDYLDCFTEENYSENEDYDYYKLLKEEYDLDYNLDEEINRALEFLKA